MEKGIMQSLRKAVGSENVSDDPVELIVHTRDASPVFEEIPAVVVRPGSTEEVSAVLKVANEHKIRVITKTGATTPWGASVPRQKGMMIVQMGRMNRVLDIDEDAMAVTVEAGCPWSRLERAINPRGWRVSVLPHSTGMFTGIAANVTAGSGGGFNSAKYGIQLNNVVGLEVVLPTGSVIKTGSWAIEGVKPFDKNTGTPGETTGLFWNSAGMLGIVTKIALRIYSVPEIMNHLMFSFKTVAGAQKMIYRVQKLQLAEGMAFLSKAAVATMRLVSLPEGHVVWGSAAGCSQVEVEEKAKIWRSIAEEEGGIELSRDIENMLQKASEDIVYRYTFGGESFYPGGGRFCLNTVVPLTRIEEYLDKTAEIGEKYGIPAFAFAHVLPNVIYGLQYFPYYEKEPGQREKILIAGKEALGANADAGMGAWTIHGMHASTWYDRMHKGTFEFMKVIKKAVDPNNIMVAPWE